MSLVRMHPVYLTSLSTFFQSKWHLNTHTHTHTHKHTLQHHTALSRIVLRQGTFSDLFVWKIIYIIYIVVLNF